MKNEKLQELARFVVREAKRLGATDSDVTISANEGFDTTVRLGAVDLLQGAQGRSLTFRAFVGTRSASTTTTDFRRRSLTALVRNTVAMARASQPDEFAGLPAPEHLATSFPELDLVDGSIGKLSPDAKIEMAKACEAAARAVDPRIVNSEGASFSDGLSTHVYANSRGFCGEYTSGYCSLNVAVVAREGDVMQIGYWGSAVRKLSALEDAAVVGRTAAERGLRMLGGKSVPSCEVPVVFDNRQASALLGQFLSAANGAAIYRGTSFMVGKLGQKVAVDNLTVIDDAHMQGGLASSPFSDEGLATGKRYMIRSGVLENYFLGAYAARKLGMAPNGGGSTNLYIPAGDKSVEEIIASVENGLYLTSASGPGFNAVTGDYSRGATGIWIKDGKLTHAVQGITIAGNVLEMFGSIEAIGSDLEFRGGTNSPTLKIGRMTIAGQ